jgi:hypothetical protein
MKDKFYERIVDYLLKNTSYFVDEEDYIFITFPMYPEFEDYEYSRDDIRRWSSESKPWMMCQDDLDYLYNTFGVDDEESKKIMRLYSYRLGTKIMEYLIRMDNW